MQLELALIAGFFLGTALFLVDSGAVHDDSDPENEGSGIFPLTLRMPSTTLHKLTNGVEGSDNVLREQISKLVAEWLGKQNDSMISVEQGAILK